MNMTTRVEIAVVKPKRPFSSGAFLVAASFMKTKKLLLTCFIAAHTIASVEAQGAFQNLNFESPIAPLVPSGFPPSVPFTNAFPGWVGYVGTNQSTSARIDNIDLDIAVIALIRTDVTNAWSAPLIEGRYTAVLQAQVDPLHPPNSHPLVPVALAQSSLVPVDSKSLLFRGYTLGTDFAVSLGGVNIPVFALESFPNYTLYGGDITGFGGSIAELRFTAFPNNYPHSTVFALDSIRFSPATIPEPGVFGLIGLGALLIGWRLRKF